MDNKHSFPRASLSENCSLLGTDNVRGQVSEHIFAPNEGYCLYNCKVSCLETPSLSRYRENYATRKVSKLSRNGRLVRVIFPVLWVSYKWVHGILVCSSRCLLQLWFVRRINYFGIGFQWSLESGSIHKNYFSGRLFRKVGHRTEKKKLLYSFVKSNGNNGKVST